ncbi:MAG: phosphatase PAP2 family protein [Bacteroidia bacterium]|nr:phosphatase PAP2 family protein [Bacteroidia bacterium]
MKEFLKNNILPLLVYFLLVITAIAYLNLYGKENISLYLNRYVGNAFFNNFFYYITYLGDGRLVAFMLLAIMLHNVRLGICSTLSFLSATLAANLLKYTLFDDVNRPYFYYQYLMNKSQAINYVEGVDLHIHNSFPSGHSTQVFAVLMCLVFASKKKSFKLLWLAIAVLTSLSRVYLSQHWVTDITAGSFIGFVFSLIFEYLIIYKNKFPKLNQSLGVFINRAGNTPK